MLNSLNHPTCQQDKDRDIAHDSGTTVLADDVQPLLQQPRLYKVVMLNDDYTPMEFVVHVLEKYFHLNREAATRVMLTVHTEGRAVCGIFTRDVAETKAELTNSYARENQHPLMCQIEPDDGGKGKE